MATALRTEAPMRLHTLIERGASAARRSGRWKPVIGKQIADAFEKHRTRGTRYLNGDAHSPFTRNLVTVDRLARCDKTQAWSLIAEEIVVVKMAEIESSPRAALEARLRELTDREHDAEAEENRQTARGADHEAAANADLTEAELQLERAAIRLRLKYLDEHDA